MRVYDAVIEHDVEQVDECDIVRAFKKSSHEFDLFYHEERMKKLGEILWRVDTNIGPVNKMRSITVKDVFGISYPIIYINDRNIPIEDVFIVAHEIMHCILTQEGNSLKIFGKVGKFTNENHCRNFASEFQTMLEDSAVDSILQNKYNFDALRQYLKHLDINKEGCWSPEPTEKEAQIYMAFNITNNILKWRIINDETALGEWCRFLRIYRNNYPTISRISDQILSIIDDVDGLETIEQKKLVYFKISEKYDLSDILTINPPTEQSI